ncbi:MAG: hypothetical protein U9Q70_04255 [Chloroflexota bacterium]|nr:hypothetical protein [Chloroflexota bacterium]
MRNNTSNSLDRREFLKWALGLGSAATAGYLLRGLLEGHSPTAVTPTQQPAAASTATSTPHPTATQAATQAPTATSSQPPTPTPLPWVYPQGPSKLGLHTIKPNHAFPFVQEVTAAGARVALVKALGGLGLLREVKSVSPETITIGRANCTENLAATGDPSARAAQIMAEHIAVWQHERDATDYWEVLNEVNPGTPDGHVWLANFYLAAMDIAEAQGYRLALFSYSTGVPEWRDWAAIVETGIFRRAQAGGHILALHEYDWPILRGNWGGSIPEQPAYDPERGVLAGRYRHLYRDFLIPRGEVIPLAITECGLDPILGSGSKDRYWEHRWLRELAWYDSKLVEDDYVLGAAIFTLGGGDAWRDFDYEALLPQLRAYLVSQAQQYG